MLSRYQHEKQIWEACCVVLRLLSNKFRIHLENENKNTNPLHSEPVAHLPNVGSSH